jgi:hypothetical protein
MLSIFDIDMNSLVLSHHASRPASSVIDFAVIQTNISNIWYDSNRSIQIKCVDSDRSECIDIGLDGDMVIIWQYFIDGKHTLERVWVPMKDYTEETFFMESTVTDFGSLTFEYYKKVLALYREVMRIIRTAEGKD